MAVGSCSASFALPTDINNANTAAQEFAADAAAAFDAIANVSDASNIVTFGFGPVAVTSCGGFAYPVSPAARVASYVAPTLPSSEELTPPSPVSVGDIPTFSEVLTIDASGQPGAAPEDTLGLAPAVVMPEFPLSPEYEVPAVPAIDGIVIPEFAALTPVDTTITLPTFLFPEIQNEVQFTNALWESANLDDMSTHVARVRNGDFAISTTIWRQIYDRAAVTLHREAVSRERAGRRAWAKLGWSMPGGVALAQQELAAQNVNESTAMKALEMAVQEATQKNDDFWKAMTQGAALEGLYLNAQTAYQERGLRFAISVQQASVAVYNAYATRYQVEVALVSAAVASAKLQIENKQLQLAENKLIIDAALARGEADKLELQLYIAEWNGIQQMVATYNAEIDAVKANLEAQKLVLDGFNSNLQAYSTRVNAWAKEWDGYASKMQGESTKATVFDSYVKAYIGDVQAYSAQVDAEKARVQAENEFAKTQAMMAEVDVSRYKAEWDGVTAQLDSVAKLTASDAALYNAQVQAASAQASTAIDCNKLSLSAQEVNVNSQVDAAKLWVSQSVESMKLVQTAQVALGNIYAQMVAAQLSQHNYSTSISESSSNSCSQNYSESESWTHSDSTSTSEITTIEG